MKPTLTETQLADIRDGFISSWGAFYRAEPYIVIAREIVKGTKSTKQKDFESAFLAAVSRLAVSDDTTQNLVGRHMPVMLKRDPFWCEVQQWKAEDLIKSLLAGLLAGQKNS